MYTWELVEACAKGGYVGGEVFMNQVGQTLYFDGQKLFGIEKIDITQKHEWDCIGVRYDAS